MHNARVDGLYCFDNEREAINYQSNKGGQTIGLRSAAE